MNENDWVASNLSTEETNEWYKKEVSINDDEQSVKDIIECDLVNEGLVVPIEELSEEEIGLHKRFKKYGNKVYAWYSFKECLGKESTIPYIICSTEY